MARYAALLTFPLAACCALSFDGLAARAELEYPDYGRPPAAIAAEEYDYEYGTPAPTDAEQPAEADEPTAAEPRDESSGEAGDSETPAEAPAQSSVIDGEDQFEIIRERYPNGNIRVEREVTQDADGNYINHGSWKMFDESGTTIAEGHFVNGQRDGTWNHWYHGNEAELFGKLPYQQFTAPFVSQASFANGKLNGRWGMYDSSQRKMSEWHFADGYREGRSIWYYVNGRTMREIDYHNGEIDGEHKEWTAEGQQTLHDVYRQGAKIAAKIEYFGNKQKKSEGTYLHARLIVQTPDDWWTPKVAGYARQGKDQKHGPWTSWYENGQKKMQGEYRNGLQIGKLQWWYENGQIALQGSYEDGKQVGKWTWWHQNGQKSTQGEYVDGNPTGSWRWWDTNGRVHETADLTHGDTKVVDVPALVPRKAEALTPHPAQSKARGNIKR